MAPVASFHIVLLPMLGSNKCMIWILRLEHSSYMFTKSRALVSTRGTSKWSFLLEQFLCFQSIVQLMCIPNGRWFLWCVFLDDSLVGISSNFQQVFPTNWVFLVTISKVVKGFQWYSNTFWFCNHLIPVWFQPRSVERGSFRILCLRSPGVFYSPLIHPVILWSTR